MLVTAFISKSDFLFPLNDKKNSAITAEYGRHKHKKHCMAINYGLGSHKHKALPIYGYAVAMRLRIF